MANGSYEGCCSWESASGDPAETVVDASSSEATLKATRDRITE